MMDVATQLLQEMNNLGVVYCYLATADFLSHGFTTEFVCVSEVKNLFMINSLSPRNELKKS